VENGGKIIAEASLGRFKDHGWKAGDAPHGMQDVFGCATRGIYAKMDTVKIKMNNETLSGTDFWEFYEPTTGKVLGTHEDGRSAVIESTYGKGSTLLIGTVIGKAYEQNRFESIRNLLTPYLKAEVQSKGINPWLS